MAFEKLRHEAMRSLIWSREKNSSDLTLHQSIQVKRLDLQIASSGKLRQLLAILPGPCVLPLLVGCHKGIELYPWMLQQQAGQFGTQFTISQWVSALIFVIGAGLLVWLQFRPTGSALPPQPAKA